MIFEDYCHDLWECLDFRILAEESFNFYSSPVLLRTLLSCDLAYFMILRSSLTAVVTEAA